MFDSLSDKLGKVFTKLGRKASLSENDVMSVSREIRIALLEADVALPVVKDFITSIKDKAVGQNVIKGINPAQQIIKIVHDELVKMLGSQNTELEFSTPPCAYLMVGLQGSGKTTSTAKIARLLTKQNNKKVLMASLDIYRPAAQEQLAILGEQIDVQTLPVIKGEKPLKIAKRAMDTGRKEGYDVVILDTAGRLSIDEELMHEVEEIKAFAKPVETLLIADAMTGQDAVNTAKTFNERIGISGIILTRVDGDARGGAAMSMKAVTGKPVKLIGVGEKWDAIEPFYPERVAGRILGMGDVVSLVEKAAANVDQQEALKMAKKLKKGQFDYNDLLSQIRQMSKMGGMGALLKLMPGLSSMAGKLEEAGLDDSLIKKQEAIILSMTPKERMRPELMSGSRKKRIAAGSGTTVQEINMLVKQQKQMQTMMKRMRKMGKGQMMGMMKNMMGGKADELDMLSGDIDLENLPENDSPLGPNPFAGGNNPLSGMGGGGLPAMGMPGGAELPGMGHGGSKKKRKKKKR